MKKLLSILMASALLLTGCGGNAATGNGSANQSETNTASTDKIVVGLDDEFPPMGFRDEKNEIVGFDIDLAKAAAEKMGCEVEFQPIDWDSKELELESGNIDFIWNGLTITDERAAAMEFTKPYLKNKQIILVKNGSDITKKEDLEGKTIGVQAGSSAKDAVEADEIFSKLGEVSEYDTNILAFQDLNIGRVDAVVADEIVARYQLRQSMDGIKIIENGDFGDEVYGVAAKKGNTELVAKLQSALDELSKDGTAAEISTKWFGEDIYEH